MSQVEDEERLKKIKVERRDDDEGVENEADYDEEEDEDYNPEAKEEEEVTSDEEGVEVPDYSAIQVDEQSQVQTRTRSQKERTGAKLPIEGELRYILDGVNKSPSLDVNSIFEDIKSKSLTGGSSDWQEAFKEESSSNSEQKETVIRHSKPPEGEQANNESNKIRIETGYTFAGRLVTELKEVDANSAEAKAYLSSTKGIASVKNDKEKPHRSSVPVVRKIPGNEDPTTLRIKLKRPSLIDKFLSTYGSKKQKLSTLEVSRLQWATFVDTSNMKDEFSLRKDAGYLDRQEFLGRVESNQDQQYQEERNKERQRQWRLQQQQL